VGLPALLEQAIMRVGIITYTRIVTSLGTILYATHLACMNTQAMSFMLGQGLAVASTSLVGQSLGKGRPDMARHYSSRTRRIGLVVSLCLAAVFVFLGREIVALYIGDEPDAATIIRIGGQIMVMVAVMLPFQSSQFILAGSLRGAGDTKSTAAISFITVLLVRPGLAALTIFVLGWGIYGAWIALIIDQILRSFLVLNRYNSGKWVNAISNRS
jgi:Na+-driven multidrug efflux pump